MFRLKGKYAFLKKNPPFVVSPSKKLVPGLLRPKRCRIFATEVEPVFEVFRKKILSLIEHVSLR